MDGKKEFYAKVEESLFFAGYIYFDGDRDIKGKTRAHSRKPDYIAIQYGILIIGEIKSPAEGPESSSWRTVQPGDSTQFASVRSNVDGREKSGALPKCVGGHEIIIRGQIPDYVENIGKTFILPDGANLYRGIRRGYSVPTGRAADVQTAISNCRIHILKTIDTGNGATTFIF